MPVRLKLFICSAIFLLSTTLFPLPVEAQLRVELEAGGGYTVVDVEGVASADGEVAQEWDQIMYRVAARAFLGEFSGLGIGAEVGYQYFYWYQVRVPFGDFPFGREYDQTGVTALGVARLPGNPARVDVGAGVAIMDEVRPMVSAAVGANLYEGLSIWLRGGAILTGEITVPVGVSVSYDLAMGGG